MRLAKARKPGEQIAEQPRQFAKYSFETVAGVSRVIVSSVRVISLHPRCRGVVCARVFCMA